MRRLRIADLYITTVKKKHPYIALNIKRTKNRAANLKDISHTHNHMHALTKSKQDKERCPLCCQKKIHIYERDNTHMTFMKIIQFSRPPTPLVHRHPKFFHPLDLGRPTSNEPLQTVNGFTVWIQSLGFISNNILIACLVMAQIQFPFIKKMKIGLPEHLLTSLPVRPITSHFTLTPPSPKVDVICVSPPNTKSWLHIYAQ